MSQTAGINAGIGTGERPLWALPNGNVPDLIANYFLRSDTPTGISTNPPPPEAVSAFRQLIRSGALVPLNQSAATMVQSYGGIQNGDPSPFGVPWLDGLPGGMTADLWNAATGRARQISDQRIAEAEATGMFNGIPTLQRQQIEAQIRQQDFTNETGRLLATANVRQRDDELARLERERQDAIRNGDLNRANALELQGRQIAAEREQFMTTATGFVGGTQGGQETLARQQQAFEQAVTAANLAANPRTSIQAQMLQGQRSGMLGQASNQAANFVAPTTGAFAGAPGAPPVNNMTTLPPEQLGSFGAAMQNTTAMGQPGINAVGQQTQQIGTTPFQQALLKGTPVPRTGDIQGQGQWWDINRLQQAAAALPGQARTQDFMRGTPSEQQGFLGLTSFGGTSDEDTLDRLRRNLPGFSAPTSSAVR